MTPVSPHGNPPPIGTAVSRRDFSRLVLATAGLVTVGISSGCTTPATEQVKDPLQALADSARADAAEFQLADPQASNNQNNSATLLATIAAVRAQHADRLDTEIARVSSGSGSGSGSGTTSPTTASSTPSVRPSLNEARNRLKESAQAASAVAVTQTGYRAQLAASISAACSAAAEVTLA